MPKTTFANQRSNRNLLLCVASVAALATVGCAGETDTELAAAGEAENLGLVTQGKDLRDPNGSYFASVVANGTGCPPGTWDTSISSDGKTFTTTFSRYEAQVSRGEAVAIKDCQLAIKLHSPSGLSYAVQDFYYSGYAVLTSGVSARQLANYYFQGNSLESREARTELKGPYDDTYTFSDQVTTSDKVVWSPCGVDRDLNVRTTLRVENSGGRGTGYINLAAVDGNTKLTFRLAWRSCNGSSGSSSGNNGGWDNDRDQDDDEDDRDDDWSRPRGDDRDDRDDRDDEDDDGRSGWGGRGNNGGGRTGVINPGGIGGVGTVGRGPTVSVERE